jgi:hypothetical protein
MKLFNIILVLITCKPLKTTKRKHPQLSYKNAPQHSDENVPKTCVQKIIEKEKMIESTLENTTDFHILQCQADNEKYYKKLQCAMTCFCVDEITGEFSVNYDCMPEAMRKNYRYSVSSTVIPSTLVKQNSKLDFEKNSTNLIQPKSCIENKIEQTTQNDQNNLKDFHILTCQADNEKLYRKVQCAMSCFCVDEITGEFLESYDCMPNKMRPNYEYTVSSTVTPSTTAKIDSKLDFGKSSTNLIEPKSCIQNEIEQTSHNEQENLMDFHILICQAENKKLYRQLQCAMSCFCVDEITGEVLDSYDCMPEAMRVNYKFTVSSTVIPITSVQEKGDHKMPPIPLNLIENKSEIEDEEIIGVEINHTKPSMFCRLFWFISSSC